MKKGELMAESSVEAVSLFQDTQKICFFSGIVNAAMKKNVAYNIKVSVNENGEIRNSHCECPAGLGPHGTCKHITAVLLVLSVFVKDGELNVSKSCTETLQTFQRPKKIHKGSPVKAENLGKGLKSFEDDPRPVAFRNRQSFQDDIRNKTVNFVFQSGLDLAMRYTFSKANIAAAAEDHSYLKRPFTEY